MKITFKIYRDCSPNITTQLDDNITLGVYNNDNSLSQLQSAFGPYEPTIPLISKKSVDPVSQGIICPQFNPNVCIQEGIYEGTIYLPSSADGYHLYFGRCCRNTQENIEDKQGQTYYCFIPPTSTVNSSPVFTEIPAPFICPNELTDVNNTCVDADGDSLVYKLVQPWAGGDDVNPIAVLYSNLSMPFNTVIV
jgi:hypothetical protein